MIKALLAMLLLGSGLVHSYFYPYLSRSILIFFSIIHPSYILRWEALHLPRMIAWVPFLPPILLIPKIVQNIFLSEDQAFPKKGPLQTLTLLLLLFILNSLASGLYNNIPFLVQIFSLRYYLLILSASLILYYFPPNFLKDIKSYFRFLVYIALLQLPVTIVQKFFYLYFPVSWNMDMQDLVSGTFSGYSTLSFCQLLALSVIAIYNFRMRKKLFEKHQTKIILSVFFPLLLSNSRAVFLFLSILALTMLIYYLISSWRRAFMILLQTLPLLGVFFLGVFIIFGHFQKHSYQRSLSHEYSLENIKEYLLRPSGDLFTYLALKSDPRMGRLAAIQQSAHLISKNLPTTLMGLGPGNIQISYMLNYQGKYYELFGPLSGLDRNQISLTLSEHGIIGVCILFLISIYLFQYTLKKTKNTFKEKSSAYLLKDYYLFLFSLVALFSFYLVMVTDFFIILIFSYTIVLFQNQNLATTSISKDTP